MLAYIELRKKCNTLENKVDYYEELIKSKMFKDFCKLYSLEEENKKLRAEVKDLKKQLKENK